MAELLAGFLANTTTLLISPRTFGYESAITEAIKASGGQAYFIDERPGNDFLTKGIIRLNSNLLRNRIERYYREQFGILDPALAFTRIVVISPEALNIEIVKKMRHKFPKSELVLYMWDSIRNKTGTNNETLLPYFDRVLSFDQSDCAYYKEMKFRPLFFCKEYATLPSIDEESEYDISFIGTVHSDRMAVCERVNALAVRQGLRTFFHLYLSNRKIFWIMKATNPGMRHRKISDLSFNSLGPDKVREIVRKSRCVLDIQHPGQLGLTMRTIEVLGARRKLLTTNPAIKTYDFYAKNNIHIIDRDSIEFARDFVTGSYLPLDASTYAKYSIDGWLRDISGL